MRSDFENRLMTTYPFLVRDKELPCNMYQQFGFEVDDGWFPLINSLCQEIVQAYEKASYQPDIVVDQIKEKYGALRFNYHFQGREQRVRALDAHGEMGFLKYPADSKLHKKIARIVRKWENKSLHICEKCGEHGVLRTELMWICVLCDRCFENLSDIN